jgi:DNA-binding NtrC family response regulator
MPNRSKVLVIFENPATLKELLSAANSAGVEILPLRDRRQAGAFVTATPNVVAVIVEQAGASKAFLEVLQNVQAAQPKLRRVVVSDACDLMPLIDGLHSGAIEAVLYRPVDPRQLHASVFPQSTAHGPPGAALHNPPLVPTAPATPRRTAPAR